MSDQPTEKHKFVPSNFEGDLDSHLCAHWRIDGILCSLPREAPVHQPSAVQAPEQATNAKTMANELVSKWLLDSSSFHVGLSDGNTEPDYNDLVVRIADAYEAQAVRIAELEARLNYRKHDEQLLLADQEKLDKRIRELEDALVEARSSAIRLIEAKRDEAVKNVSGSGGTYQQRAEWAGQINFANEILAALKGESQ